MAQTTIQGTFLGDATVTGAKVAADFISAQTALTTGLATTDEIIVSDAGVIKRMDISVLALSAAQLTSGTIPDDRFPATLPAISGANLTNLPASGATLATSTNHQVVTVTGSNAMTGQANLIFDGTALAVTGTGISSIERQTSGTNSISAPVHIRNKTSNDAADGFGSVINFQMTDTGVTDQQMGYIGFERHGADNSARFLVNVMNAGSLVEGLLMDNDGAVTKPLQPCFYSALQSHCTNVTGDGTSYTMKSSSTPSASWGTSGMGGRQFVVGSCFSGGTFTAPVSGYYYIGAHLGILQVSGSHDYCRLLMITSNGNFPLTTFNASGVFTGTGQDLVMGGTVLAYLDENDTAYLYVTVYGGSKVIDIQGHDDNNPTRFFAMLMA